MSDHDRGAYTPPTDEPLAFDARRPQTRRPMPVTLIASGAVLVVLISAVALFYQSGVRGANEAPRVVGEPVTTIKTAPTDEAQPIDQAAGLDVYVDDGSGSGAAAPAQPTFAPPPEQPLPRPVATTPAAVPTAPVTKAPTTVAAALAVQPPAAKAAPAPVKQAAAPEVPAVGGSAAVQIGAFKSQAIADQEFAKVAGAFSRYASGKAKRVEAVQVNGETLYRTAFAGFSRDDARAFCQALKAAGRDCLVK